MKVIALLIPFSMHEKMVITLVTFPPHCCHRLQPQYLGVMGPFKGKLHVAQRDWMTANPGKVITIHDLASLTSSSFYCEEYNSSFC
jgi:hypothetical protein